MQSSICEEETLLYSLIELSDAASARSFAYKGKAGGFIGVVEDEVKAAVKSVFEGKSYQVTVQWGQKAGCDIEATLGSSRIIIEAKGEGSRRQMLGNYFLQALGQIILRMGDPGAEYGIAFPAHPSYIELVLKIPTRVRQALRLDFYFVRRADSNYEIGVLRWLNS